MLANAIPNSLSSLYTFIQVGGAIYAEDGETVVNNCVFLENVAATTAAGPPANGGAIGSLGKLMVVDSIFKKNKAIAAASGFGGGGAITAVSNDVNTDDVLVLSSVFELNEASNTGGAALFENVNVAWYNNKELLLGNDAGVGCDGVAVGTFSPDCSSVEDNFSI